MTYVKLKTDKMTRKIQIEATEHWVLNKYPNAKIEGVGSNNLVTGLWYQLPNNSSRSFTPLLDIL